MDTERAYRDQEQGYGGHLGRLPATGRLPMEAPQFVEKFRTPSGVLNIVVLLLGEGNSLWRDMSRHLHIVQNILFTLNNLSLLITVLKCVHILFLIQVLSGKSEITLPMQFSVNIGVNNTML